MFHLQALFWDLIPLVEKAFKVSHLKCDRTHHPPSITIFSAMISGTDMGRVELSDKLRYMTRSDGKDLYKSIPIDTFKSIEEIDRIISGGVPLDEFMLTGAVLFGNIDVVQRLVWGMGGKLPPSILKRELLIGCYDLEILKFLVSLGCPLDEYLFAFALRSGDLDLIKWVKSIGNYDWDFKLINYYCEEDIRLTQIVNYQLWENGTDNAINILEWMKSDGCEMCTCGDYEWGGSKYIYYNEDRKGHWVRDMKEYSEHDFSGQELSHGLAMKEWLASQVCSKHGK